uniref:Uncharacterized protein n=1 Tax=Timema genevievae TaxID=629358 RepID=A0A7R9JUG0_TIMGE|nr:unnamed protein product [Timema genevievae]
MLTWLRCNLKIIQQFKGTSDICKAVHLLECPCLFGLAHAHKYQKFEEIMQRCQEVENEVAQKSRFLCNVCRAGSTRGKPTLLLEQWTCNCHGTHTLQAPSRHQI